MESEVLSSSPSNTSAEIILDPESSSDGCCKIFIGCCDKYQKKIPCINDLNVEVVPDNIGSLESSEVELAPIEFPEDILNLPADNIDDPPLKVQITVICIAGAVYGYLIYHSYLFVPELLEASLRLHELYMIKLVLSCVAVLFVSQMLSPLLNRRFLVSRLSNIEVSKSTDSTYFVRDSRGGFACLLGAFLMGASLTVACGVPEFNLIQVGVRFPVGAYSCIGYFVGAVLFRIGESSDRFKALLVRRRVSNAAFIDFERQISYTFLAFIAAILIIVTLRIIGTFSEGRVELSPNIELLRLQSWHPVRLGCLLGLLMLPLRCYCRQELDGSVAFSHATEIVIMTARLLKQKVVPTTTSEDTSGEVIRESSIEMEEALLHPSNSDAKLDKHRFILGIRLSDLLNLLFFLVGCIPIGFILGLSSLLAPQIQTQSQSSRVDISKIILVSCLQSYGSRLAGGSLIYHSTVGVSDLRYISFLTIPIAICGFCTATFLAQLAE